MNACGAAPQTGNLLVCAENIDGRVPPSFDLPAGRYVRIEIEDNGTGIPEGIRNSRFEDRFPAKRPGLDLATVKSILQEHRGGITIKSSNHWPTAEHPFRFWFRPRHTRPHRRLSHSPPYRSQKALNESW
jgi:signal transduction histidine kinase